MNDLVIARYAEDLDWIAGVPETFRVIVYNKGGKIDSPIVLARADRIVHRVNEGRESETFLHHMTITEGDAAAYTVFAQGDPFEHSPDFFGLLDHWAQWQPVQALSCQWKGHLPPPQVIRDGSDAIAGLQVRRELFCLANWGPLHFMDEGALRTAVRYWASVGQPEGVNIASHFLRRCRLEELADRAAPCLLGQFAYGAIFAARNDRILALPRESLFLMRHLTTGPAWYGYVMERLWLHLLGMDFLMPVSTEVASFEAARRPVPQFARVE